MNYLKRLYLRVYRQLGARKNLFHLRDRRAFAPILDQVLVQAATLWPEVLPWKPRTYLDIGAYQGTVAEQIVELYHPRFVGLVEPQPEMVASLRGRTFAPRQRVWPCALGRTTGTAILNLLASTASSSLLEVTPESEALFHVPLSKIGTVQTPVRTLDEVFEECGLHDLDLLKIDVQGYEAEVLAGGQCTLSRTRLLVMEVSFFEHYNGQPLFADVYGLMNRAGFELLNTFGYSHDIHGLPLQCDAVFINRAMPEPSESE